MQDLLYSKLVTPPMDMNSHFKSDFTSAILG